MPYDNALDAWTYDDEGANLHVRLITNAGDLNLHLYHRETPKTSRNFMELAKGGRGRVPPPLRSLPGTMTHAL